MTFTLFAIGLAGVLVTGFLIRLFIGLARRYRPQPVCSDWETRPENASVLPRPGMEETRASQRRGSFIRRRVEHPPRTGRPRASSRLKIRPAARQGESGKGVWS